MMFGLEVHRMVPVGAGAGAVSDIPSAGGSGVNPIATARYGVATTGATRSSGSTRTGSAGGSGCTVTLPSVNEDEACTGADIWSRDGRRSERGTTTRGVPDGATATVVGRAGTPGVAATSTIGVVVGAIGSSAGVSPPHNSTPATLAAASVPPTSHGIARGRRVATPGRGTGTARARRAVSATS